MKKAVLGLLLMLPLIGFTQTYHPFKPGVIYVYSGIESGVRQKPVLSFICTGSHTILIDSSYAIGNDSCYLNYVHFSDYEEVGGDYCRKLNREFWFGKVLVKKNNGDFLLIAKNNDTTLIKTQVYVNDTFVFLKETQHPDSNYLAVVKSKQWETFQQLSDSVITYSVIRVNAQKQLIPSSSNFNELKISKQYGVVQWVTPDTATVITPDFCSDRPNAKPYPSWVSLRTYEVGDEFEYTYSIFSQSWIKYCYERVRVLNKQVFAQGDSIRYTFGTSKLNIPYKPSMGPIKQDTSYLVIYPPMHSATMYKHLALGSGFNNVSYITFDSLDFGLTAFGGLTPGSDSCWREPMDGPTGREFFRPGIGLVYSTTPIWSPFGDDAQIKELYYYKKGNTVWGASIDFNIKMGEKEQEHKRVVLVYPNPVKDILSLELSENSKAEFVLYDLLGQKIQSESILKATNRINLTSLKPGVYLYSVTLNSGQQVQGKLIKQ